MVDTLVKEQALLFKSLVKEKLLSECPADETTKDTCEVDADKAVTNDGSKTCFTMSYLPDFMTMELSSTRICGAKFNDDFAKAFAIKPDPDKDKFDGFKIQFKATIEMLLEFKDITPRVIGEYNGSIMKLYQGATQFAEQSKNVAMIQFVQRGAMYIGFRKATTDGDLKKWFEKEAGQSYEKAELAFVADQLKEAEALKKKPEPVLEYKFQFAEAMMELIKGE